MITVIKLNQYLFLFFEMGPWIIIPVTALPVTALFDTIILDSHTWLNKYKSKNEFCCLYFLKGEKIEKNRFPYVNSEFNHVQNSSFVVRLHRQIWFVVLFKSLCSLCRGSFKPNNSSCRGNYGPISPPKCV